MTKCQTEHKHPSFTIGTDLVGTMRVCVLASDMTGTQIISLVSYKPYPVYIDMVLQSMDECIRFVESGDTEYQRNQIFLPPAQIGNPTRKSVTADIIPCGHPPDGEDCIRIELRYYTREDAADTEKNDTLQELYPRIELSND